MTPSLIVGIAVVAIGFAVGLILGYSWGIERGYEYGVEDGWRSARGGEK